MVMFQYISFSVAVVGSALAGAFDLKTTEIPDEISLGMVAAGLIINLTWTVVEWNPVYIFQSASIGSVFFTFGLVMYLLGQWGGGDTKVLTGLGTLVPVAPIFGTQISIFPFPAALIINIFLVGALYMIVYAGIFSIINKGILSDFKKRVKNDLLRILLISSLPLLVLFIGIARAGWVLDIFYILLLVPMIALLLVIIRLLKSVEQMGFMQEISTDKLRPGDMLAEEIDEIDAAQDPTGEIKGVAKFMIFFAILPIAMYGFGFAEGMYFYLSLPAPTLGVLLGILYLLREYTPLKNISIFKDSSTRIRGLNQDEVEKIKKNYETVKVREGVRFGPVFTIALIVTVYYGNLILLLV